MELHWEKAVTKNLKFEGGSAIAAFAVDDDGLDNELLFAVLGHYQWLGVCRVVVERSEVVDVGCGALATDEILDNFLIGITMPGK